MVDPALDEQLDDPVWFALTGPHARFAVGSGSARRYDPAVSAWSALRSSTDDAWDDLRAACGPGGLAAFFERRVPVVPRGHEVQGEHACVQLIAPPGLAAPPLEVGEVVDLGPNDVAEMARLVGQTKPGPFFERTVELGGYVGAQVDGELVAMAGQRMRTEGACEISAVCTRTDHRGRGLAAALTGRVAQRITNRGEIPFLHARLENAGARRLYEHLGFETRTELTVTVVKLPD
jgi:ribosomal protein S18 acetylase RimI-like enzyme